MSFGRRRQISLFVFLLAVSLGSSTFFSPDVRTVEGGEVKVYCEFGSRAAVYHWEIDGVEYSKDKLPAGFFADRGRPGVLRFMATAELNGTNFRCVVDKDSEPKRSNSTTLTVLGCMTNVRRAFSVDSESLELNWDSGCGGRRAIKHLQVECNSETEYRRVNLRAHMHGTKIVGLTPWTHFNVHVTIFDSMGGSWRSETIKLMTRRAGVPPPPRFLNLIPVAVPAERRVSGRPRAGIDVFFSSCDQGAVLGYTVEVSMDANFSSIENVTNIASNMSRKLEVDGLQENTTYWMRMKSVGVGGESLYSAAQEVQTLTVPVDNMTVGDDDTTVVEEMQSNGLLVATVILSVLFVASGFVVVYLCLFLRYHKNRQRAMDQAGTQMSNVNRARGNNKEETDSTTQLNRSSQKRPPDSPGISVSDLEIASQTQDTAYPAKNEMKVIHGSSLNGIIHRPKGYANGTFYQL